MKKSIVEWAIESHKFFVKESPSYMAGTNRTKYLLMYPIAYCSFMYGCLNDFIKVRQIY